MHENKNLEKAISVALRYLSHRPRSEAETRDRLRRNYDSQTVESAIERLKESHLIDDSAFAAAWSHSRISSRPRSIALIRMELFKKGVDREVAQGVLEKMDDEENAYKAGIQIAKSLANTDYPGFRRRMWDYLRRRAFDQFIIRKTVRRVWEEREIANK